MELEYGLGHVADVDVSGAILEDAGMSGYTVGDIVQIIDEQDAWFPSLLIVTEPKSWGVQGCVIVPNSNDGSEKTGQAYRRLTHDKIKKVGEAEVIPE